MLTQIHIRDLATIEELNLSLTQGTTVITGETGAGKSVFIEAIELALGGRASPNMIRVGKERAEISLCFDVTHFPHVIARLQELDLYHDAPDCIIRRIITADGRSRCYVNGSPATLQFLKELGECLFHLHGQHEQQVLLKTDAQREMLDRFAEHLALSETIKQQAEAWKDIENQIQLLRSKTLLRADRSEYLRFQLEELQALGLQPNEWETLENEHRRLIHSEELLRHIQFALQQISEDESCNALALINETRKNLEGIHSVEPQSEQWVHTLHSLAIQLQDLESQLRHYLEHTALDPEKLATIETRISQIFNLARKHKVQPAELITFSNHLSAELQSLNSSDEDLIKLEAQQKAIAKSYHEGAQQLSLKRKKAALKLEQTITTTIRSLSLPHGEFKIQLEKFADLTTELHAHGYEKIIFQIKTNPDANLQPLTKVISGGELSRLSLAIHLALAHQTNIPTLIFDEVDTGLGGATAEKIGKLLRQLGQSYQVFCVTHQPQVAAYGHQHLLVEKYFADKSTHTRLRSLNQTEKATEIARMLGGEKITPTTLKHAEEILVGAEN